MVLPMLLAVTAGLLWLLVVGLGQMRVTDAAREAARALARGEDPGAASALAARIGPSGSRVSVEQASGLVTVTVSAGLEGPGGLLAALPGADLEASATAALEPAAVAAP
ncbi:hypothetical protein GCM10027270_07990 [Nocardioides ginkgobilobae]